MDVSPHVKKSHSTCGDSQERLQLSKSQSHSPTKRRANPLEKLEQLETLGNGSYGTVVKVRKKADGQLFAMKIINKRKILQGRKYQIYNERDLLDKLRHPCIVRLKHKF